MGNIKFDELSKYGLDRFSISVTVTKSEDGALGYKIETYPIDVQAVIDQCHGLLPGGLMQGSAFASATMMSDGALVIKGFHDQTRVRLAEMLRTGRDEYFAGLEAMFDETPRRNIAGDVADAVITKGITPDDIKLHIVCGHCGGNIDVASDLLSTMGMVRDGKMALLPGSWPSIKNGDFKASFDEGVRQRFSGYVKEQLRNKLPKAREMLSQIERGIALASKLACE